MSAAFDGTAAVFTAFAVVPDSIEIASGDGQTAPAGAPLPDSLVVRVLDQTNQPMGGVKVGWEITTAASGDGALAQDTTLTDSSGLAMNEFTLGTTEGDYEVTAGFQGLTKPPAVFSATAVP
ncbi:MAG: hypothetical protein GWN07_07865, partial [Actinobacteria bacterium]|nr:hypothetical protein [Actinomycetota bacterium]NIS30148.1 hypothetical protein [Actinomycetota bacterium]NIU65405.1 hypothetical protein [Actinomycetota bacterium]NIW27204.1 hypothetical protein [Actinomycetota bacterium]NIX19744.1 hypothetical protein [Actinomycetota bacterium]